MLKLRDYQEEAVQAVLNRARQGIRRQLVVLPTGAGKTLLAAALSQKARGRVLMLVNREELVEQSVEKMGFVWPEQEIGVVKAERDEHDRRVVVASIQTLQHERRRERIDKDSFSLVIVDEAHHTPSPSVMATLTDLGFLPEPPPGKLLMGMTATPMRGDGVGLNTVFDEIVYRRSIADLIRRGYLADIKGVRVRTEIDLQKVRVQRGDFQTKDLSLAVDTPKRNAMIVDAYREHGEGRKAVAFTVDVAHAKHMAEAFLAAGYRADWVSGELPLAERRERLRRLRDGELDVLANCQILTEGWDEPSVGCLLMARPTKSVGLYTQMVGRGLRPYPGKDYCVVIDVADNAHDVCAIGTLEGEGLTTVKTKTKIGPSGLPAEGREEPGEIGDVSLSATPLDLLSRSRFKWRIERRRMVLEAGPGQLVVLDDQGEDRWSVTLHEGRDRQPLTEAPLPLSYAQGVAEDYVRENDLEGFAARDAKWRSLAPSKKQVERMQIQGITPPYGVTREEANDLIREAVRKRTLEDPNALWRKEPASPKQIDWMEKHGFQIPDGFTKGDFNNLMDRMKHRGKKHA